MATYHGDHAYCFDVTSAGCESARYPIDLDSPWNNHDLLYQASYESTSHNEAIIRGRGGAPWRRWRAGSVSAPEQAATPLRQQLAAFGAAHGSGQDVFVSLASPRRGAATARGNGMRRSIDGGSTGGEGDAGGGWADEGAGTIMPRLPPAAERERLAAGRALADSHWSDAVEHLSRRVVSCKGFVCTLLQLILLALWSSVAAFMVVARPL